MTGINAITFVVDEPSAVARRLVEAFGWEVTQDYGSFAEVVAGQGPLIWLNVPSELTDQVQQGVLVHCQVDDVRAAAERARAAGATIVLEPTRTDFGTESAWAQVEGGPIVDLSREL